jgi:arylsulfatase A-like enzyme
MRVSARILSQRWPWAVAAVVVVAAYLSTFVEIRTGAHDPRPIGSADQIASLADGRKPNILFIMVDTLRASRMSVYGYANETTPYLERYAASGVRFDRHLAQSSWTKCSMASLWTGMYPPRTGVTRFNEAISDEAVMPAEVLKEAGYRTVGIYRNGWVNGYFGFEQGFDVYVRPNARPLPASVRAQNPTLAHSGSDMDILEMGLEFLRLHGDDPWLLYLHLMDVHEYVYDAESALFGTTNSGIYDNAILREDYVLETLIGEVARLGHLDDTIVVIASDHGEAFGERGFEGHAREVHAETTEVPLILGLPFRLEKGAVVAQRTTNVDLWPTLFDLIGLEPLHHADGVSRVPEILAAAAGTAPPERDEPGFAFLDQTWGGQNNVPDPSVAVTDRDLRYIVGNNLRGKRVEMLFDRSDDPSERRNLAEERPEEVERLGELAKAFIEQQPPWEQPPPLEIDEMDLNQLRALGYAIP